MPYTPLAFPNQQTPAPPPPDLIDDEEQYEIEEVLDSRSCKIRGKKGKKSQEVTNYFVKWKGWTREHNSWCEYGFQIHPIPLEDFALPSLECMPRPLPSKSEDTSTPLVNAPSLATPNQPSSSKLAMNSSAHRILIQLPVNPSAGATASWSPPLKIHIPALSTGTTTKATALAVFSAKSLPTALSDSSSSKNQKVIAPSSNTSKVQPCPILRGATQTAMTSSTKVATNKFMDTFMANVASFGAPVLLSSPSHPQAIKLPAAPMVLPVSSTLLAMNAASRPRVLPGPDPTRVDGGSALSSSLQKLPLFFVGTDNEDSQDDTNDGALPNIDDSEIALPLYIWVLATPAKIRALSDPD
ncbi:hypothetical protein F5146DRAFT_1145933 [Armillaria mellea]|nr:hypothetical protein F5146DRAFT_1145933 [Armillaria mellea]